MNSHASQPDGGDERRRRDERLRDELRRAHDEIERLEQKLGAEHSLFESAMEHNPNGLILVDREGAFLTMNSAAKEIWGGGAEVERIDDWEQFRGRHPDGTPFEPEDWSLVEVLQEGRPVEPREVEIERFDGESAVLLCSAAPIYGTDGKIHAGLAVFSDITELKRFEEAQRRARITAERAASRLSQLQKVTTELFDTLTPEEAVRVAMERAKSLLDADRAAGALKRHDGTVEIVAEEKFDSNFDDIRQVELEALTPLAESVRMGNAIFVEDDDEYKSRFPNLADKRGPDSSEAFAVVPLLAGSDVLGALSLGYRESQPFENPDRAYLQTLAGQCGHAVRRAELYQDEQRARAAAESAHRRTHFVSEATAILNSSLDYDEIFEQLADLVVPDLAGWCAVDLAGPEHDLRDPVAVAHCEPEKVEMAREYRSKYPPNPEIGGAAEVMETGEPMLWEEVPDELLEERTHDREQLAYLRKIEMESIMVVPMTARGRALGAITFVSSSSDRQFDGSDLELAQELADRAAMAADNARLHSQLRRAHDQVSRRAEQQEAVSELARRALEADLETLFDEALATLADLLEADTAKLVEYHEDETLTLRAGTGWVDQGEGANLGPIDETSGVGHALLANEVVVIEEFEESEFSATQLVEDHDLRSALLVQVPGPRRPFGAIGVHSRETTRFTDEDSQFIRGISNVLSDAIEKARAVQRREATYQRLAEAMREREELLSVLSHDLRSPASSVKMNLELVRRHLPSEQLDDESLQAIEQCLDSADGSLESMVEMMTDLLEVARNGEDGKTVTLAPLDFGEVLRDVLDHLESDLANSDSSLEVDIEEDVCGRSDRVRFEQIAANLVSNAIKYGEGEPIELTLRQVGSQAELVVCDHGVGIDPEDQEEIFERFHRVDTETDNGSFGLGLWIVKQCVDALDGTIDFDSTLGEGTQFRVRLPMEPQH